MVIRRIVLSVARTKKRSSSTVGQLAKCAEKSSSLGAATAAAAPSPAPDPELCRALQARGIPIATAGKLSALSGEQAARRLDALERIGYQGDDLKGMLFWGPIANAGSAVDVEQRLQELTAALAALRVDREIWATIVSQHKRWIFAVDASEFQQNLANLCSLVLSFQRFKVDLSKWIVQMRPSDKETLEETTNFLLEQAGSEKAFCKVVQCVPMVLQYDVEKHLQPRITTMESLGFSREQITKIIYQFPKILTVTPERLTAVVGYLTEELGFSSDQACRVITIFPRFSTSKLKVISGKVDYFVSLGMQRSKVRLMLRKNPSMVGLNIERGVKPKLEFLASLDFKGDDLDYLLSAHSGVLTRNSQAMEGRLNLLLRHGLSRDECSLLLRKKPSIFNLGDELLSKKLAYYTRVMKQPLSSLCHFSSYLTFSMEAKVVPRTTFQHWLYMSGLARKEFSQPYMIMLSSERFTRRFLGGDEALQAYGKFVRSQLATVRQSTKAEAPEPS
ncbi:hypothetical protein SELMODRAFT_403419 [Selaginella moellendorffii]|uniref:Uncharacterized protein n=1 Tax=Selaginella moellendorffii TaxID=88036 RepID=D8QRC7_SELML|nr:uncharacterized protein LOC9657242 [Selaginella moellendorffii]EFJ37224.1 hypothetical protein SELMODRAFT_403419 [Selaginella moellendorffii]|eukprot:XP_002961964.1 uncharacterized protein LOC9657242 [Selaginella moellendorffii]